MMGRETAIKEYKGSFKEDIMKAGKLKKILEGVSDSMEVVFRTFEDGSDRSIEKTQEKKLYSDGDAYYQYSAKGLKEVSCLVLIEGGE